MNDLILAASETTFRRMFHVVRDGFQASHSGTLPSRDGRISWDVRCHLENGEVNLQDDNSVAIDALDLIVDRCRFTLGINLPRICVGGQCVLRNPLTGNCVARLPRLCVFDSNPDMTLSLNIDNLFRSEVTASCRLYTEYYENPARDASMSQLEASLRNSANEWRVFLRPLAIDVDHFDMAGSAQAAYNDALTAAVNHALAPLPGWARAVVIEILGPIGALIEMIMDIPDDVNEWLSDLLNMSIGFHDFVYEQVVEYFAERGPIHKFEDAFQIMPAKGPLVPVVMPLLNVRAEVNAREMLITADAGVV